MRKEIRKMELTLTEQNFEDLVLKADKPVLVDFWAPWCMPCRMVAPVVEELAEDMKDEIAVGKVNVDEQPGLAERYRVHSIPTLIRFDGGQEQERLVGVQSRERLELLMK